MQSMTGFGGKEMSTELGTVSVELRSSNHKFLETVVHLPPGYLALEDRIKKLIESKVKRGRITCAVNFSNSRRSSVHINEPVLKSYVQIIRSLQRQLQVKQEVSLDTIIQLPGVLQLEEKKISSAAAWTALQKGLKTAVDELVRMRAKEGKALHGFCKSRAVSLRKDLNAIRKQFRLMVKSRLGKLKADEERVSFLKSSDITEEIERLSFHIRNFGSKLSKSGPIGKELDFIAQEMQRESNTLAAKSCDILISGRVVQMKSQIERIREQVQNIE